MKRLHSILLFLVLTLEGASLSLVDFHQSMQTEEHQAIIDSQSSMLVLELFNQLYSKNISAPDRGYFVVPRIMHHIWFGKPFPEEFKCLRSTWLERHPDWVFLFWTDRVANVPGYIVAQSFDEVQKYINIGYKTIAIDVKALVFDNRCYFDQAPNYGEKSDILKWEVVYRFGGVYIDTDFECYKPLDMLHRRFDFYTALQPLDTNALQLGAALYGARPEHPILKECVDGIKEKRDVGQIIIRTGPIHFTHSCIKQVSRADNVDIVFPASYFYPCGYQQSGLPRSAWYKDEAFGVHHWAGSWLNADAFVDYAIRE